MQIVWFKRDLRIYDHAALWHAHTKGIIIPLYIFEPELWTQPDMSHRQFMFLLSSLRELDAALTRLGQPLIIRTGDALDVLRKIIKSHQVQALWSHQETWNNWTYQRDIRINRYLKDRGIIWHELRQNGVIRRLKNRRDWANQWQNFMSQPALPSPEKLVSIKINLEPLPSPVDFRLYPDGCHYPQQGGRLMGLQRLNSFLYQRGEFYQTQMSSPLTAFDACSRLSPYLAFGTLSMRETFKALQHRLVQLNGSTDGHPLNWQRSLQSFKSRLFWHCHFIQKLEDEPQIEFSNMHTSYDHLSRDRVDTSKYQVWTQGQTGYPFIDACMRALVATGWINFRMRAMLMSFASYHLWLDWRQTSIYLASLFTDYEPGIHYPQCQMQSGTTGINTLRIYNPIKQSEDQDPEGLFIRRWIPELDSMPTRFIHQPWLSDTQVDYPPPIVDEKQAREFAVQATRHLRQSSEYKNKSAKVLIKHANRRTNQVSKKSSIRHRRLKIIVETSPQLNFTFSTNPENLKLD